MNALRLCDSHCHLDFTELDAVRDQVLDGCERGGVKAIVVPGVVADHWSRLLRLCRRGRQRSHPVLKPALGLHPCFMAQHRLADLCLLEQLLRQHPVVAVGEVGLDFSAADTDRDAQTVLFVRQLLLARQFQLPVLLHARKSHDEVLKQLRLAGFDGGGIVHAFSGSEQQAEQYIGLGFKLGVGGGITYPRAQKLRRTVLRLGIEHWVLETDAPGMPLSGRQGRINRPDYLPEVLAVLVTLLGGSAEQLSEQLWVNSDSLFGALSN